MRAKAKHQERLFLQHFLFLFFVLLFFHFSRHICQQQNLWFSYQIRYYFMKSLFSLHVLVWFILSFFFGFSFRVSLNLSWVSNVQKRHHRHVFFSWAGNCFCFLCWYFVFVLLSVLNFVMPIDFCFVCVCERGFFFVVWRKPKRKTKTNCKRSTEVHELYLNFVQICWRLSSVRLYLHKITTIETYLHFGC